MASGIDLQQLLEKASKVSEQAEVFHLDHKDEPVMFESNRLKLVEARESSGVAVRLIKDGRIGLASTSNFQDLDALVNNALEMVAFGPEAKLDLPAQSSFTHVDVYDEASETFPMEDMIRMGQEGIDRLRESDGELVCDATVSKGKNVITILNSKGASASYSKTTFSAFYHGTKIQGTDMLFVSDGRSSCSPFSDISDLVESVRCQLEYSRELVPAPTGNLPVIFTPKGVAGALLSPLLSGFNGRTVFQGTSPLVDKLGEKMVGDGFSVWDRPTMPYAVGSRMCDDEGLPTSDMPLVDGGTIANFLYDLQTAALAGVESTASAQRGLSSLPSPGASVIVVSEGDRAYSDMIKDVDEGLMVERLLGAGQSNILGGDFNANVLLGYKIEKGSVVGRVKNTVISGNVYLSLKNIVGIESESHWVGGSVKTPALCLGEVSVATKEQS